MSRGSCPCPSSLEVWKLTSQIVIVTVAIAQQYLAPAAKRPNASTVKYHHLSTEMRQGPCVTTWNIASLVCSQDIASTHQDTPQRHGQQVISSLHNVSALPMSKRGSVPSFALGGNSNSKPWHNQNTAASAQQMWIVVTEWDASSARSSNENRPIALDHSFARYRKNPRGENVEEVNFLASLCSFVSCLVLWKRADYRSYCMKLKQVIAWNWNLTSCWDCVNGFWAHWYYTSNENDTIEAQMTQISLWLIGLGLC